MKCILHSYLISIIIHFRIIQKIQSMKAKIAKKKCQKCDDYKKIQNANKVGLLTLLKKEQRTTLQIKQLAGNKKYNSFQNHMKYFKHYNFMLCAFVSITIYLLLHFAAYTQTRTYVSYMFQRTALVE